MIKTVSFAPPRGSGARPGAKTGGAKVVSAESLRPANSRAASGRTKTPKAPDQTSLEFLFDAPDEPIAPLVEAPLAPIKAAKPKLNAEKAAVAAVAEAAQKSVSTERISASPKVARVAPQKTKTLTLPTAEAKMGNEAVSTAPVEIEKLQTAPIDAKTNDANAQLKAKRVRVPKDLAAQYGEKVVTRVVAPPVEAEIVKKRLSKVERQARRDLIKPSDDLMARLARANQISLRKPKSEPRGKGWKFVCGRCGITSYFETAGGLCACGTIAVKE